ncbi:hypothetical protein BZA02_105177 [Ruegeria sp. P4]|nr:hypothetical protein BZA02_105177 [Ruegeria sp. P4]
MAVIMKLKYIDELSGSRRRFRRRWPKDVAEVRGETFFQKPLKARSGPAMVTEWEESLRPLWRRTGALWRSVRA